MNTLRNIVLALCTGSIVAIAANIMIGPEYKFSSTAFALGFFVFSAVFVIKPIRIKDTEPTSGSLNREVNAVTSAEKVRSYN